MFQLLRDPNFDFMRRGRLLVGVSLALVIASVVVLFVHGINLGIEFTGGTELQIKYADAPNLSDVRSTLERAGITAQVTTIGAPEEHEIYIRVATEPGVEDEAAVISTIPHLLRGDTENSERIDLNVADQTTLEKLLLDAPGLTPTAAGELASAVATERKNRAIIVSLDELSGLPGASPEVLAYLGDKADIGPLAVRSQSFIGPSIGHELLNKAELAIVLSLIMMLLYIWIRFQLQWGFAAVLALAHDTVITLGLFSLFGEEMSLPVVAAFLTLVGYSVNDTVVVFDRIRENLRNRSAPTFLETINLSINQTLGRTIITSGLTWIVVFGLYLYGGAALNAFAFVLSVGVIVGTYSSVYIASPILLLWHQVAERRARADGAVPRQAKKVRSS